MRMRRVRVGIVASLLLSLLLVPQLALAAPAGYSIGVVPLSGVYNDLIDARVVVEKGGTYHLCWNTPLKVNSLREIKPGAAGNFTYQFNVPAATRGTHTVHLIEFDNNILASASFIIYPTVTIDLNKGTEGTDVVVRGYGFTAAESNISVKFRGTEIGKAQAGAGGSWEKPHTIPAAPGGAYVFEVGPDSVTAELWRMPFTITPKITISPASARVGETVRVSATGFASGERGIQVTIDGLIMAKDIPADGNGSWTADIIVPPHRGGTSVIDASGPSTRARDVPDVELTVRAGIVAEPGSAYVGDRISVAGGGFAPWETGVRITFANRAVETGTISVDKDGRWQTSFVLPAGSTYGPNTVSASGDVTRPAVTATVSTLARVEVSPAEAVPGASVTVTGDGFPGNQALTVTFANRAAPEGVQSLADGKLSAVVTVPASPVGTLLVTVTGGGAQASADFTVKEKVLPAPQLISPGEGKRFRSKEITFEWGKVAGSDATYNLQVAPTAAFTVVSWSQSGIEGTSTLLPEEEALPRGEYYWRVMAVDEWGNESQWSEPRSFKVSPIPIWVWVVVGVVVLIILMVVAYREERFKISD